jgi:hypothetical protein
VAGCRHFAAQRFRVTALSVKRHVTSLMREILEVHAATLVAQEKPLTFPG